MGKTITQLIKGVALQVNGSTAVPVEDSDEYNTFLESLDQAQSDVASADYDWQGLRYTYRTSVPASGTSLALPDSFVKPMGFPVIEGKEYPEIGAEETGKFLASDKYVTFNLAEKYMAIHPALASASSVNVPYLARPSSLATASQTSFVPSDNYLIQRASYYVLLGRENPRYVEYLNESDKLLAQMIGQEVNTFVQKDSSIKNELRDVHKFRLGVD
jgi:hypothetical protein